MEELIEKSKQLKKKFYFYMVVVILYWLIYRFFDADRIFFHILTIRFGVVAYQYAKVKNEIKEKQEFDITKQ